MKFGLVLSGGGARGLAHIGVLKALEENGITPDIITGTSMGGMIGAPYALGYDAKTISDFVMKINPNNFMEGNNLSEFQRFTKVFNVVEQGVKLFTKLGFDSGEKLRQAFKEATFNKDFDDLKIPFACTAVDLITGRVVVLNKGKIYEAMYATGAIAPFLEPYKKDGMLLMDGGLIDNAPVDVARDMGADKVLVIDVNPLQTLVKKNKFKNALDLGLRALNIAMDTLYLERLAQADFLIQIPIKCDTLDFSHIEEVIKIGYRIAKENIISKDLKNQLK
ncbi:MAG: patatin-like phospholipase family protein [Candidatus Atribacteria bacterium]|nr:patatin-like phospholipase family protein [Candidatus Atribacteria bacterium]